MTHSEKGKKRSLVIFKMFVLGLNDPCLRGVQNTVGEEEFFREGSHFANLDITPRNLQMGTVVKEKKKRLAKK